MSDRKALDGKTALVTGGAKRIGRACAIALAEQGARVIVHYNTSEQEAADTAAKINGITEAVHLQADLSREEEIIDLFNSSVKKFNGIDILINSASIFPEDKVLDFSLESLTVNIKVNTFAPLVLSRLTAQQREEHRRLDIINFLDTRIIDNDRNHASYHLSKRELFSITRMLALELAPRVRVNAIAPGLILPPEGKSEDYMENLKDTNPLHSTGSLDDITRGVIFLLTNRFMTGQVLFIDGGRHMKGNMYGI